MYPQQPQQPQTPGYGAPQQPGQYPGYTPGYPPPTPGYGQPVQPGAPTPGYGQPSQNPGQYPPPGYAAPGYPGYPAGPTPGYGPPPTPRGNTRLPVFIVGGLVILAIIIGLVARYNGPTSVAASFVHSVYQFDSAGATNEVCTTPDAAKLRQSVSQLSALNPSGQQITADTSQLVFTITQESLSTATVSFSGNVTLAGGNGASSGPQRTSGTISLDASGLWWCVASTGNGSSSGA